MKVKAMCALKSKLLKPCKKLLLFFRLKAKKKPLPIRRALKFHAHNKSKFQKFFTTKPIMPSLLSSLFRSPKKSKDMEGMLQGLKSPSNMLETPIFPSPFTPAYARVDHNKADQKREDLSREVEDACRSFENYLVEMIVEEGKTKDLMDVEELLYCWKNLKCPVFIDLVCRFYGELCKDLFSSDTEECDSSK